MSLAPKPDQFFKMLGAALADRIGKRGCAADGKGDVLNLYEARPDASLQAEIEPRSLTGNDFTPDASIALQLRNRAAGNGFGHQMIRVHRVDADPSSADSNHFPGVKKTPSLPVATRDIHYATGFFTAHHTAGIGTMSSDDLAASELYVGEKALVALDQGAADQA